MSDFDAIKQKAMSPKTAIGAAIGGAIGAVFGGVPGVMIGSTLGAVAAHAKPRKAGGEMTAARKIAFESAMTKMGDPAELREFATTFEGEGLHGHAWRLRARADLRELPEAVKAARRTELARAFASDNPEFPDAMSKSYEEIGAYGVARSLRDQANAVRAAHAAGKSAKPLDAATIRRFEAALVKAVETFGETSPQAKTAASNLLRARGKPADDASIADMIARAITAKAKVETPPAPPAEVPADVVNPDDPAATPEAIAKAGAP